MIWKRFTASRMQNARYETIQAKIDAGKYRFTSSASKLVFDGFMAVYVDKEKPENNAAVRTIDKRVGIKAGIL